MPESSTGATTGRRSIGNPGCGNPDGLELPVTDDLARTNLAIPMRPTMKHDEIEAVVEVIASANESSSNP